MQIKTQIQIQINSRHWESPLFLTKNKTEFKNSFSMQTQTQIQIQIQWVESLQVQGVTFIVETSQSCFFFFGLKARQGQRPQSLALSTIVIMIQYWSWRLEILNETIGNTNCDNRKYWMRRSEILNETPSKWFVQSKYFSRLKSGD